MAKKTSGQRTSNATGKGAPKRGQNAQAVERTLEALDGALTQMHDARVQALRSLAVAVDADPSNASLWREYRAAEQALMEVQHGDSSELDDLLRGLTEVGDSVN